MPRERKGIGVYETQPETHDVRTLRNKMVQRRTAYEISSSQVSTPDAVISLFWQLARDRRSNFRSVLDMGAADCRFAREGMFDGYVGIEIDPHRVIEAKLPKNGRLITGCAFEHDGEGYDACVGNPPYVRHHDLESPWKEQTAARLSEQLGISLNGHCNLYLYFLCLALLKTHKQGLVALVIPYEWVSRPSAKSIRNYITAKRWNVDVYRFNSAIFPGVLTTASISVIDKAKAEGRWRFFEVTPDFQIYPRSGAAKSEEGVLDYESRGPIWALRGLSPGSQKVFTLSEGERIHNGLSRCDVVPCVTTLRHIPRDLRVLTHASFEKHYVETGAKCWLIRSNTRNRSAALNAYLKAIPEQARDNYTCRNQTPWFNYLAHPVPKLLVASGFVDHGPKVLINSIGATAVGAVFGIHSNHKLPVRRLQAYLLQLNVEQRVVAHAKTLKKLEVKQANAVLNTFANQEQLDGRTRP